MIITAVIVAFAFCIFVEARKLYRRLYSIGIACRYILRIFSVKGFVAV